jgi:hypothetical protein
VRFKSRSFFALLTAAALFLEACGGGSLNPNRGGSPPPPFASDPIITLQSGNIQLPSGSTLPLSSLTVTNSLGPTTVSKDGSFGLYAFQSGPQFAQVVDRNGDSIMVGFLGPTEPAISARSTAEVLTYFAAGLFTMSSELRQQAYAQIANAPGFSSVETAVGNDIAATPGQFPQTATALRAFIATLTPAITGKGQPGQGVTPHDMLIDPGNSQSGITALQDSPVQISFRNEKRRMALAYIDQVSQGVASGSGTAIVPAPVTDVVAPVLPINSTLTLPNIYTALSGCGQSNCISATTPLKSFSGTLKDLMYGNSAFAEIETGRTTLPATTDALWTRYRITVVGPGAGNQPPFPPTSDQTGGQLIVSVYFLMTQLLMPLIANVILPAFSNITSADALSLDEANAMADMINSITSGSPDIALAAQSGDMGLAMIKTMNLIVESNAARALVVNAAVKLAFKANPTWSLTQGAAFQSSAAAFANGANSFLKATVAADILLQGFDASVVGHGLLTSDAFDQYDVYVTPVKINLTPATPNVTNDLGVHLTVNVPSTAGSGLVLTYAWQNSANHGHFKDLSGDPAHVDNWTCSTGTLTGSCQNEGIYTANHTGFGTDTVSVTVGAIDSSGSKVEHIALGSASATITVPSPTPSPTPDPGSYGTPPTNLPQSRCAGMAVSPHESHVGATIGATVSYAGDAACGGDIPPAQRPTWTWSGQSSQVISGCTANSLSCTFQAVATGSPGNRYVQICLNGNSRQGPWISCDYYGVAP